MLPFDAHAFDVVVIRDVLKQLESDARLRAVMEVYRVLRPGGRAVVIEDAKRSGVSALFRPESSNPQYERSGGATHVLQAAGFRGARTLAERERQLFVEGIKPAT